MGKLTPPPLPPSLPPSEVTRAQIKEALEELLIAPASRVGRFLNYVGPEEIGQIYKELEAMAVAGELNRQRINNQVLFALIDPPGASYEL